MARAAGHRAVMAALGFLAEAREPRAMTMAATRGSTVRSWNVEAESRWLMAAKSATARSWGRGVRGAGISSVVMSVGRGPDGKCGRSRAVGGEVGTCDGHARLRSSCPQTPRCHRPSARRRFRERIEGRRCARIRGRYARITGPPVPLVASAAVVTSNVPASSAAVILFLVFDMSRIALAVGVVVAAQASHAVAQSRRAAAVDSAGANGTVAGVVR